MTQSRHCYCWSPVRFSVGDKGESLPGEGNSRPRLALRERDTERRPTKCRVPDQGLRPSILLKAYFTDQAELRPMLKKITPDTIELHGPKILVTSSQRRPKDLLTSIHYRILGLLTSDADVQESRLRERF
jgi:hypothetical protein